MKNTKSQQRPFLRGTGKGIALLFIFFLIAAKPGFTQDDKFRALFIYNFSKNIDWPPNYGGENFVICVYGSATVIEELKIIAGQKKAGNKKIEIRKITKPSEVTGCHILYVPTNKSDQIKEIYDAVNGKNILLVTEKPGLAKSYACINYFFDSSGKLSYELNALHIKTQGLKVGSVITQYGIPVN